MEKDTNLFDLCVLAARGIGRGFRSMGRAMATMIRLTFRGWWIVLLTIVLFSSLALYLSRDGHRWYKADGVIVLNGPSVEMTRLAINRVRYGIGFSETQNNVAQLGLSPEVVRNIRRIQTYDVIDCLNDSVADFVDYKNKATNLLDTLNVHMSDRLAIRLQLRNVNDLPMVETALLNYFNSLPQMQRAYDSYKHSLEIENQFAERQFYKLDSLTTSFYFEQGIAQQMQYNRYSTGLLVGEREIHLFVGEIRSHLNYMKNVALRNELATAPVVLLDHFCIHPVAVNDRIKYLAIAIVFGWLIGCLLALLVERRKQFSAWLKK